MALLPVFCFLALDGVALDLKGERLLLVQVGQSVVAI